MSDTQDIIATILNVVDYLPTSTYEWPDDALELRAAADRLQLLEQELDESRRREAELDAVNGVLKQQVTRAENELDAVRLACPPCPTCGGTKVITDGRESGCVEAWPECVSGGYNPNCCRFPKSCSCTRWSPCPACVEDGRMPFERMAAIVNAVFDDEYGLPYDAREAILNLRGIK